jgi:hypothetical protein
MKIAKAELEAWELCDIEPAMADRGENGRFTASITDTRKKKHVF